MADDREQATGIRVFLSYARDDDPPDQPFVRRLHTDLKAAGFTVWFDRESLMSRGKTFHQEIKDAIRTEVDRVVYIGGPKAAHSTYVREEWRSALQYDHVFITPILRSGDIETSLPGELSLLHCEDFRDDAVYPAALETLIRSLREPVPKVGALFGVPDLPPNFVGRPELMRRVRDALLVDLQTPQVITSADARVGVQGMGGIGKSVVAAALARSREVREAYPDGVVWVSFGEDVTVDDLLRRLRDVVHHLGGDAGFGSLVQGESVLRELLQSRAVLLVLDDVWRARDAQPFDVVGPRSRILVTTRDAGILHVLHGELLPVSLFTEAQSLQLLADSVNVAVTSLPPAAREVARECGNLPLALALSGGMAKKRGGDFASVLERLHRADLEKIADRESINPQHRNIWRAMQASIEVLDQDQQHRFAELSVFAADRMIPENALAVLWEETGGLDTLDTEALLIELSERSLVQLETNLGDEGKLCRRFRLHDLLYDYAARVADHRKVLHRQLLNAYHARCPSGWHTGPNDGYFFEYLCIHLIALEEWDKLIGNDVTPGPLSDLLFIQAKCEAGLAYELVADYNAALAALPELAEENERLAKRDAAMVAYNKALRDYASLRYEWLQATKHGGTRPEPPYPPLPEQMQDESHRKIPEDTFLRAARLRHFANFVSGCITSLSRYPTETLPLAYNWSEEGPVAGSVEARIERYKRPWLRRSPRPPAPPVRPQCLRTLEGHGGLVTSVSASPDGRHAVSGSDDKMIRFWDLDTGFCLRTLEGHRERVESVSVSPDGKYAASGSRDKTVRLWDLEKGVCLRTLEGHGDAVTSVCVTPDGRRGVSGSADRTVRLWDLETGTCLETLEGHGDEVMTVSVSPDGRRAASGSCDGIIRVWDLETGACLGTLEGHSDWVRSVGVSPDGRRVVSGSRDNTIRLWDVDTGECLKTLEGHRYAVTSVCVTPDGRRAVSGSGDWTVRVWDLETGACLKTLEGHGYWVMGVSVTPDGRHAVSGSVDKTVRLWDLEAAIRRRMLEGRDGEITSVSVTPDKQRAISGGLDNIIRFLDLETGSCLRTLEGHGDAVTSVSLSSDGRRAVSGSRDKTVRLWDLETGRCMAVYQAGESVLAVMFSPDDSRIVCGTRDGQMHFLTPVNLPPP